MLFSDDAGMLAFSITATAADEMSPVNLGVKVAEGHKDRLVPIVMGVRKEGSQERPLRQYHLIFKYLVILHHLCDSFAAHKE
jgi:hypothetical protein